jgi:SAD/SRA domain
VDGSCQKRRKIGRDSYLGAESTSNIKPTEDAYRPSSSSWSAIGRRDDPVPDHGDATRQCIIPVSKIKIEPVFTGDGCNDFDRSQMAPDRQPLWRVPNEEAGLHSETNSSQRAFQQDLTARGAPTSSKIKKEESTPDPRSPLRGRQSSQGGGFRGRGESPGLFVPEGSSSLDPSMSDDDENDPGLLSNDGGSMSPTSPPETPEPEDHRFCQCPINLQCPVRPNHLIDCRKLILEWEKWNISAQTQFNATLGVAVPPVVADFTTVARVQYMLNCLTRVENRPTGHVSDRDDYRRMVSWVAEMQTHSITQADLNTTSILPRLRSFLTPVNSDQLQQKRIPLNLLEDLRFIVFKWSRGDLLVDSHRGIVRTYTNGTLVQRMDPAWAHLKLNDDFYGHGHLINGQRWETRFQVSRDGAHGAPQAGICGGKAKGARSIMMGYHDEKRHEFYADVDMGQTIYYIGTAQPPLEIENDSEPEETNVNDTAASSSRGNRAPTNATQALMKSRETGIPVRLIRSYKLADIVPHKPGDGFRYDGLYRVISYELLKKDRRIYRFKLTRLRPNDPASGGEGPLRGVVRRAA